MRGFLLLSKLLLAGGFSQIVLLLDNVKSTSIGNTLCTASPNNNLENIYLIKISIHQSFIDGIQTSCIDNSNIFKCFKRPSPQQKNEGEYLI